MTYSLSNLLQDIYKGLGQTFTSTATGGSVSTIIDNKLNDRFSDDDFEDGGVAFVVRDSAGASAAPEMEFGNITDYDQDSETFTLGANLTAAVASGDTYMIATATFPIYEVWEACNVALRDLGYIALPDTSLTAAEGQTEYAYPVALKAMPPIGVMVETNEDANDNRWQPVQYKYHPSSPNSTGVLVLPQLRSGDTIKILYKGIHPTLTAYNSYVSETIHPRLARLICTNRVLEWYNRRASGTDDFWVREQAKVAKELEVAKVELPIWKPKQEPNYWVGGDVS